MIEQNKVNDKKNLSLSNENIKSGEQTDKHCPNPNDSM